jgi:hypothetical protein
MVDRFTVAIAGVLLFAAPGGAITPVPLMPARRGTAETSKNCTILKNVISTWDAAEAGYDVILPIAIKQNWTGRQYDDAVARYVNSHVHGSGGGLGASASETASTNMCTCESKNVEKECNFYRTHHLPEILCEATKAHEEVHRQKCDLPPTDPNKIKCDPDGTPHATHHQRRDNEHAAYEVTLKLVGDYYFDHCATCKALADARAWVGAINLTYARSNRTSSTNERLTGSASYTSRLTPPVGGIGVSGYTASWMGQATGSAQFDDDEQWLDGKAYSGRGNGDLVKEPPLGKFSAEILRIDPDKCVYAFETSAAISSNWNGLETKIDGTHVQLGGLKIEDGVKTLAGSKTLPLPISHFDWPGPAVLLPNEPTDWRAAGQISGSITISWSFTPTR